MAIVLVLAGLVLLAAGGESLIRGAARLAAAVRITPVVIGLTVVAFGTSAPELAVSVQAALSDQGDVALGNVVGSNIFNILLILGLSALLVPLSVAARLLWWDVPLMIAASALVVVFAWDGTLSRWDGLLLSGAIVAYTVFAVVQARRESPPVHHEYQQQFGGVPRGWKAIVVQVVWIAVGLGLLALGSRWLVRGAVEIARSLGISELIIGLTIVAAGTSLPEVVASVVASLRGQRDIAVGNVVGSNLFNLLAVLGSTALVGKGGLAVPAEALAFDLPVMIATALACLPIFFTGHVIARWEGALFLGYYGLYLAHLILGATQSPSLRSFDRVVVVVVLPLTAVTLAVGAVRALRPCRPPPAAEPLPQQPGQGE